MKDTCMLSMPALSEDMTVLAVCNLNFCKLMIFSSMVALVIIRYTFTTFFCPILWALSIACRSFIGFQSCSTKITWEGTVTIIQQHQKLREGGRFPRVFGDEFGEEFGDKFGDEFSESLNLVMNLVRKLVTNLVIHQNL